MMLTAAAYSNVVGSMIPPLGYNTFLDHYIFFIFCVYTLLSFEVCFVALICHEEFKDQFAYILGERSSKEWDRFLFKFDAIALATIHLFLFLYVLFAIFPIEDSKTIDLDETNWTNEDSEEASHWEIDDANSDGGMTDGSDHASVALLSRSGGSRSRGTKSRESAW